MGRSVPKRWQEVREALKETGEAYLPLDRVLAICNEHKMDEDEAKDFIRISHRLGHLIHYEHDPALQRHCGTQAGLAGHGYQLRAR